MAFHVRDIETDRLVRELAATAGVGLTEAIRAAVVNELRRLERQRPLHERLEPILSKTRGRKIDDGRTHKEFWDDLG